MNLTQLLFCNEDDFANGSYRNGKKHSWKMAVLKDYERYVRQMLRDAFPGLVSFNRFIEFLPSILMPLTGFMQTLCAKGNGIAFIDSTSLRVCENLRIPRHKTFKTEAARGKSSTGWFYGFKLHLFIDDCGSLLSFRITRGNVNDRKPVPDMLKNF